MATQIEERIKTANKNLREDDFIAAKQKLISKTSFEHNSFLASEQLYFTFGHINHLRFPMRGFLLLSIMFTALSINARLSEGLRNLSVNINHSSLVHLKGEVSLFGKFPNQGAIRKSKREKLAPDIDSDGVADKIDRCPNISGLKELNGCPDSDTDGVADIDDSCSRDKGLVEFNGCPDRDNDKVIDKLDECPDLSGSPEFKGCPDNDNDGTPNRTDLCPDLPGPKNHSGCPDTDGDGIFNNEDRCISVPGPKENRGCPWQDKDGDGVFDKDDECPTVFGSPEKKGCPKLAKTELETLKFAFDNLEFQSGRDIITESSYPSLDALAALLVKKRTYGLRIEGHTDNVGTDEHNLILSQKRTTAVKKYLIQKGVKASLLEDFGYGELRPIADNDTPEGRQKNRRVEMKIIFH